MADGDDFNAKIIAEFRANGGKVGGFFQGQPRDPQWYRNVRAHPDVTIEIGGTTAHMRARAADPAERASIWAMQKERMPHFADYEKNAAPREIPVILLDPVA